MMLNCKSFLVKVNNMPNYPVERYVVASYDDIGKQLWYYGTWSDADKAREVAEELPTGVVLENIEGE